MNDKTPEPHWNDIEGIILNDLKKGRIDRYHKHLCYQAKNILLQWYTVINQNT